MSKKAQTKMREMDVRGFAAHTDADIIAAFKNGPRHHYQANPKNTKSRIHLGALSEAFESLGM